MLRSVYLLMLLLFFSTVTYSQVNDSTRVPVADSLRVADSIPAATVTDTLLAPVSVDVSRRPLILDTAWTLDPRQDLRQQILLHHPFFNYRVQPIWRPSDVRKVEGSEGIFYGLVALLLVFALLKMAFAKYYNDLFRVFFRTTLKQRQIREQLMQSPLPSLMLNIFFIATGGLYLDMVLHYYGFIPVKDFWLMYLYCCLGLAIIYFVKFIGLKICGWLFNMKQAADSYIFIVFIINKVIGVFLVPFIILLAFTSGELRTVTFIVSFMGIGGLLLYRFILGFSAVRNEVRFNLFHFFLYLVAFEAAPLLLIYRVLLLAY